MERTRNKPGNSARQIADRIYFKRVFWTGAGVFLIWICIKLLPHIPKKTPTITVVATLALLIAMKMIGAMVTSKGKTYREQERRAEKGAKAEESIELALRQLPDQHDVFHDVNTGYGDIDHILLSKEHGLFLIETKSHHGEVTTQNGKLLINGKPPEKDFIAQTLRNMIWLKERVKARTGIGIWIQPIIVFTHAFVREWKPVNGILLRNQKYLIQAIQQTKSDPAINADLWERHIREEALW